MNIINNITECRICKNSQLDNVISLGEQIITSRFPKYGDYSTPKTPIDLCKCSSCGLLQLKQTTFSSELYEYEYGYRSGISNTMRKHLKDYQEEVLTKVILKDNDVIVDIGSNDATTLHHYPSSCKRIGVDPTGNQFKEYYDEIELIPNYFTYDNFRNVYPTILCKIVSSISMFYDLPDPVQFAKDIYAILETDGIWTCEQSYMPTMINTNSIDTICHEHLEYYSFTQIKTIADMANFKIVDVKFNNCNGGSFRVYFAKQDSNIHHENLELISSILQNEKELGIMNNEYYYNFMNNCKKEVHKLTNFIDSINRNGKNIYIYGASTKGNCLLQFANIGEDKIKYAVERNPNKVGKMTNTGIEIISEDTMRENPPDFLLVLPWHFREEIIEREETFLKNGGQLVFPFPTFEIVSYTPRVIITGCDGMISQYVKEQLLSDYTLYGITRNEKTQSESNITKMIFDMNNRNILEEIILTIKPDVIIHLAAISSAYYSLNNPIETLHTNGIITATLCEIIHTNKLSTKLFNASSSEIYKGHIEYNIKDDDTHKYHNHPYSIAKIMAHSIVDFYRETYGLPFSNGVIFTTESKKKSPNFLLNKIAHHIRNWKNGFLHVPLTVGNLDSYRNILHASDVASAIGSIIKQDNCSNYLICNNEIYNIKYLVMKLFEKAGISIEEKDDTFYDKTLNIPILYVSNNKFGFDSNITKITGDANMLKNIGWIPKMSIDNILDEIIE
jgi:GDP-mannose 4,6-dehydratase